MKALHTKGELRPPQESCYLGGGGAGVSPALSEASRSPHTRRCINKAVHIQSGAHPRRCTQKAVCGHRSSLVI